MGEDAVARGQVRESGSVPTWLAPCTALGMGALGLACLHYGFDLVDEGTLLAQLDRVRAGQWPYRDFHTGHGPAFFWVNGTLLAVFGAHLDVVRLGLIATHALSLAALASLAARAIGWRAAVAVLALVASFFLPVAPGAFCIWNIPYPAWYAHACGTLALLAALAAETRGRRLLVVSGVLWGLAFCVKQNTGVLGLAATVAWRAVERGAGRGQGGSALLGGVLAVALGGGAAAVVSAGTLGSSGAIAVAVPVLALAVRVARARPARALMGDSLALGAGFVLLAGPVLLAVARAAGWQAVAGEVLHLGSGAAVVYAEAYPGASDLWGALAGAASGLRGARQAMEQLWFVVFPVAHLAAVAMLRPGAGSGAWRLSACAAPLYYVQLFPRADYWHLLPLAGVSLVAAIGAGLRALEHWLPGRRPAAPFLAALLVLAAVRWLPTAGVLRAAMTAPPADAPRLARATVRWDLLSDARLRTIPDVVAALDDAPAVVGFPALGAFAFLTGKPSPLRHDYFFPGVPGAAEMPHVLEQLAAARSARVVVLREDVAFFPQAFRAHADVDATITSAFPVVERIGPYEVRRATP